MGEQAIALIDGLAESHPLWLIGLAFLLAFIESLAIVGILIPGILLLFLLGAVIGPDWVLFLAAWLAASTGALAGDGVSYWLGWRFRDRIPSLWPFSRRPDLLYSTRAQFQRHGGKAIVIARFVGPMRPLLPMIAGSMDVPKRLFLRYAVPACLVWAPVYLLPGVLFGASLELAAEFAGRLATLLVIVVVGLWLLIWLTRQIYEFTARRSSWWLRGLIRWVRAHPRLGRLLGPLLEPGGREVLSVAMLGLLLLASLAVLLGVLVATPFTDMHWDASRQIASWAASLRNHLADPVMAGLVLASSTRSMLFLAGILALILLALGRRNAAWHWLAAVLGGWFLGELLRAAVGLMVVPPEVMPSLGQIPYQPMLLTCLVFGFFAVLLAKDLAARYRKWPYLITVAVLGLTSLAHFYLGLASLLGLLAALALGLGWLALVGIGYRTRASRSAHAGRLAVTFYLLALGTGLINASAGLDELLDQTRLQPPVQQIARTEWLAGSWRELPDRISRLGRYERTRFDLQIAAPLDAIVEALVGQGWREVPEVRAQDLWSLLLGRLDPDSLPHLNKDFAGRPDDLVVRLDLPDGPTAVLRLWFSGTTLEPGGQPLWLGQVRAVKPGLTLGSLTRWQEQDADRGLALAQLERSLPETWRLAIEDLPRLYARPD